MEKTYKDLLQQISEPTIVDWISAAVSIFGVIVAIVAAFLVYRQIKQTSDQMQNTALEQALDSELRTRPYVYLELIPGLWGEGSFDLKIKNSGKTFAREV